MSIYKCDIQRDISLKLIDKDSVILIHYLLCGLGFLTNLT